MAETQIAGRHFVRPGTITVRALLGFIVLAGSMSLMAQADGAAARSEAGNFAEALSRFFSPVISQLSDLARDPAIVRLFETGEESELDQEAERRVAEFKDALKLRLLVPGLYELDLTSTPPLSFASIDLLRRAETTDTPINPEVLMYGTDNAHIVVIERVKDDTGNLIGLVHLSLGTGVFEQAMSGINEDDAYMEFQQTAGGKTIVLAESGDPNLRSGEPVIAGIGGTGWKLSYWSNTSGGGLNLETAEGNSIMSFVGAGVAVVLVAGILVLLYARRSKSTGAVPEVPDDDDSVVYAGAIEAIMKGDHPGMEKLVPNLDSFSVPGGIKPLSQGLEGDDITMMPGADSSRPAGAPAEETDAAQAPEADASAVDESDFFDLTGGGQVDSEAETDPNISLADIAAVKAAEQEKEDGPEISPKIFRTYDIRGVVGKELTPDIVGKIGRSIGSEAAARDQKILAVGRDGRTSSPELADALISGLNAAGRDVIDIGQVPTPVLYFATHTLDTTSGVMLTGSHNGPDYNGLKIVLAGETLSEDAIRNIYNRIIENNLESGQGSVETREIMADYIRRVSEDIPVALGNSFKLVVDCGNGVAGGLAPQLYRALGHDVIELFCEIDGKFPNHHPDPSQPENLQALIDRVREEQADLGFAFDGDGDRLGVVDGEGKVIWPDRQMMILAKDVLSRNAGAEIIYDVKCSRHLKSIIESNGGKPLMWKTGHSLIKSKMKEIDAPLAGEMSGHIFFKERWYGFDDALYTGARLLEVLMNAKKKPVEVFAEIPDAVSTPELRVDLTEEAHQTFMDELKSRMDFEGAEVYDIDGFRVEFPDAWGLVRPSNTTPCLVLRFEADNQEALTRIQSEFHDLLLSVNPDLKLPF